MGLLGVVTCLASSVNRRVRIPYPPPKNFNGVSVWDAKGTCNALLGDRYPIAPPIMSHWTSGEVITLSRWVDGIVTHMRLQEFAVIKRITISRESGTHGSLCGLTASAKVEKNCGKVRIMWEAVILECAFKVLSRFWIVLLVVGYRTCGMVAGVRIFHNSIWMYSSDERNHYP